MLEEAAYIWFNRIIAIRYMEIHEYLPERVNVLSSSTGKVEPDIVLHFASMELEIDKTFNITSSNITEFKVRSGKLNLAAIKDLFKKK